LGSAQHLDALDVRETEVVDALAGKIDVVDAEPHRGLCRRDVVGDADAADEEGGARRLPGVAVPGEVGNVEDDLLGIEDLSALRRRRSGNATGTRAMPAGRSGCKRLMRIPLKALSIGTGTRHIQSAGSPTFLNVRSN
jgi:hypothetical protein